MSPLVVVVDPGHGGRDPGAVWPPTRRPEFVESNLNLDLAQALERALAGLGWDVACELTRDTDDGLDLDARGALSAKLGADLVLSLHHNASAEAAHGLLCFVRAGDDVATEVAESILSAAPVGLRREAALPIECGAGDWTSRALSVLRPHQCPAVLVECGFLTSERDRRILASDSGQGALVAALLVGVARFRQLAEAVTIH